MSKPPKKPTSPLQPPAAARAGVSKAPLIIIAVTIAALAIGAVAFMRPERIEPAAPIADASTGAPAAAAPEVPPAPAVALAAHTQKEYPPLDLPGYPLGRAPDVINAAYMFAAEHPEVLTYVPCFCGCERSGH